MSNIPALAGLEDEEDLEALRLAALQSLKKINPLQDSQMLQTYSQQNIEHPSQFWQGKGFRNKKGKTFGMQYAGRGSRNFQGHFNNRVRSSNLISIPTVPEDSGLEEKSNIMPEKNPQKVDDGEKSQDSCSKFERYNNSDKSESESEEEADVLLSEEGSPRLKKSDSLEALMQELDNEIQGKMISEEKLKGKKSKRRKKEASETIPGKEDQEKSAPLEGNKTMKTNNAEVEIPGDHKEPQKSIGERNNQIQGGLETLARKRPRSKSPPHKKNFYNRRRQRNFIPQPQNFPVILPYGPDPVQFQSHRMPFNGQQFNPMFGPPGVMPNQGAQQFFENPLPPLIISTDSLPTPILAPLSPRSAAFVLENKAIIERRRRSPRRSYSRSSSRSPVRSLSPRRSPKWSVSPRRSPLRRLPPRKRSVTPKRKSISPRRKSISPRRLSPSRRKSLSPRRKSISPRRKSISPRRRSLTPRKRSLSPRSPNRRKSPSPKRKAVDLSSGKAPVRDRLGVKSRTDDKEKPKQTDENPKNDDKTLDPVLEARRRKFESNEIKIKEGIIRLRPKDEKSKEEKYVEPKEIKSNSSKPKEDRSQTDKMKEEKSEKPKHQKDEPGKDIRTEAFEAETRSTTPKPKENIVEVAPATTTTEDKQVDDSVPDEFKELEKLLLGDDLELDPKVEDIFSDEDSASDNEGRFKVKEGRERAKPRVISFTKLVNGEKREIKSEPLAKYAKNKEPRDRPSSRTRNSTLERKEKKTPSDESEKKKSVDKSVRAKSLGKQRISFRTERPPPTMDKRFERKIEIKIKNPSKYERSGKSKVINKSEMASSSSNVDRKVNMDDKDDDDSDDEDDDFKPEIIVDNGSDEEFSNANEGDLRAQLSKKRAEKLHKIPVDEVSSRLLKYALKGAVFKKSKKKSKDKDISSSDAKPPIHLRLGLGNPLELIAETRTKRKSRKRKNREILEQLEYDVLEK